MKQHILARYLLVVTTLCALPFRLEAEEPKPFKLGFISILTGPYSEFGQGSVRAAQLAVEDYEREHPEENIELIVEDDGGDQKKGLSAYLKLRDLDKTDAIMPISTFGIGAVRELVNKNERATFIVGNEPFEPADDYIFMVSPDAVLSQEAYGKHVAAKHPEGRIIMVTSQNEATLRFGRAFCNGAGPRAELLEIPGGTSDFATIALKVRSKQPVAIAFAALPEDSARLLKELRRLRVVPALYFDDTIGNSLETFKTVVSDLSVLKDAHILNMTSKSDPLFVKRFEEKFKTPAVAWLDYVYDSVALTLRARSMTGRDAREWAKNLTYSGVSGTISFNEVGVRKPEFRIRPLREDPRFAELNK